MKPWAARMSRVAFEQHARALLRVLLSYYMTNGYAVALGYLLISAGVGLVLGTRPSSACRCSLPCRCCTVRRSNSAF